MTSPRNRRNAKGTPTEEQTQRVALGKKPWLASPVTIAIALCLAVLVTYSPVKDLGWIWDDDDYVLNNPTLRTLSGLGAIWGQPGATPQYYPAVFSVLWLEFQFAEFSPELYHFTNVALHALNAVLCYLVLRQLQFKAAAWVAFAFALHPIQVESVAWITELKNVLSASFYGLAWLWLWPSCVLPRPQAQEDPVGPPWKNRNYWIGCSFFVLALLSKSVTASLPAAILVAAWYRLGNLPRRVLIGMAPLFLLGVFFGWNTARLERVQVGAEGDEWSYSMLDRCGIAARSVLHYTSQSLVPMEQMFFYPRYETDFWTPWNVGSLGLVTLVAIAGFVLAYRGQRGLIAACAFFVGSALPSLSFFNVYPHRFSFVADHFVYIPIVGLFCMIGFVLRWMTGKLADRFVARKPHFALALLPATAMLCGYAVLTYLYIPVFTNQLTLWEDTLEKNPDSVAAMQNLGLAYVAVNRQEEARKILEKATEYDFDRYQTFNSLGLVLGDLGRLAEAEQAFLKSIELKPENPRPRVNLGNLTRIQSNQTTDAAARLQLRIEAKEHYQAAWEAQPNYLAAFGLATMAYEAGDLEQATQWFQAAVDERPRDVDARYNLVQCLAELGKREQATEIAEGLRDELSRKEWRQLSSVLQGQ